MQMQGWEDEDDGLANFEVDFDVGDLLQNLCPKSSGISKPAAAPEKIESCVSPLGLASGHEKEADSGFVLENAVEHQKAESIASVSPLGREEAVPEAVSENAGPSKRRNDGCAEAAAPESVQQLPKKARTGDDADLLADFITDVDWNVELEVFSIKKNTLAIETSEKQDTQSQKLAYTIPGPAGVIQLGVSSNQRYDSFDKPFRREDQAAASEESNYRSRAWLKALEFFHLDPVKYPAHMITIRNIKSSAVDVVPQLIAIIKTCISNGCGDAFVTLKDPTGTISGTIHRKLLAETEFGRDIVPDAVILLSKVAVFRPSIRTQYLNITMNSVVQVFRKS